MSRLDGLIRLNRWQVDEKRRELAGLEAMRQDLVERRAALEQEMQAEQEAAQGSVVQFTYAAYVSDALKRRDTLTKSIADVDQKIAEKQFEVSEAVRELKKVEIVDERRRERERAEQKIIEQNQTDEIALNVFRSRR